MSEVSKSRNDVTTGEALDALAVLMDFYDRPDIEKAGEEFHEAMKKARAANQLERIQIGGSEKTREVHRMILAHRKAREILKRAGRL